MSVKPQELALAPKSSTIKDLIFLRFFPLNFLDLGQEVMGPAYRTAAGMMLCMFFAVTLITVGNDKSQR